MLEIALFGIALLGMVVRQQKEMLGIVAWLASKKRCLESHFPGNCSSWLGIEVLGIVGPQGKTHTEKHLKSPQLNLSTLLTANGTSSVP